MEITQEQEKKLDELSEYIKKWNGLNLIGKSTEEDIWGWHIKEGLSIIEDVNKEEEIVDFGAGSGVIGLTLAILGCKKVKLLERSQTKLNFLKTTKHLANCEIVDGHKHLDKNQNRTFVIRGVNSINSILGMLCGYATKFIFFKNLAIKREIDEARTEHNFRYESYQREGNAPGKIVFIELKKKQTEIE